MHMINSKRKEQRGKRADGNNSVSESLLNDWQHTREINLFLTLFSAAPPAA